MNIDYASTDGYHIGISLSRRNLLALLAKLDGHPVASAAEIARFDGDRWLSVTAEEDDVHYNGREAGPMHPDTEAAIHYEGDARLAGYAP